MPIDDPSDAPANLQEAKERLIRVLKSELGFTEEDARDHVNELARVGLEMRSQ